jgi:hypothetical protein
MSGYHHESVHYNSEDRITSIIRVTGIGELGTLAVTANRSTLRSNRSNSIRSVLLLVNTDVVPISLILVTLMMEEKRSSATSVLTAATRRNIPEDENLQ